MVSDALPADEQWRLYYAVMGTNGDDGMKRRLERVEADIRKFLYATIGGSFTILVTMVAFLR